VKGETERVEKCWERSRALGQVLGVRAERVELPEGGRLLV
jgi:hypothetical protein